MHDPQSPKININIKSAKGSFIRIEGGPIRWWIEPNRPKDPTNSTGIIMRILMSSPYDPPLTEEEVDRLLLIFRTYLLGL